MPDSKNGLLIGRVMAFVGLRLPFVFYDNSPSNVIGGNERVGVFAIIATPFLAICFVFIILIVRANRPISSDGLVIISSFLLS